MCAAFFYRTPFIAARKKMRIRVDVDCMNMYFHLSIFIVINRYFGGLLHVNLDILLKTRCKAPSFDCDTATENVMVSTFSLKVFDDFMRSYFSYLSANEIVLFAGCCIVLDPNELIARERDKSICSGATKCIIIYVRRAVRLCEI